MVKANEKTLSQELEDMPFRLLRRAMMHACPNTVITGRVDRGAGKAQGLQAIWRSEHSSDQQGVEVEHRLCIQKAQGSIPIKRPSESIRPIDYLS